jgi:glycosyltransferase involved in cell wall biosynthesis
VSGGAPPTVEVLLATRDGERFLPELLASLHAQTYADFGILARDDASRDGTEALLRREVALHPDRFTLLQDADGALGARDNFSRLMAASTARYVMFSDQDDCWKPEKVAVTLEAMRAAESIRGVQTPILVHTDLRVVDEQMRELGASFWKYQRLRPELGARFERTLVQNVVTGCTAMANRSLLEKAGPIPEDAVLHDWWLALVASAFGAVVAVPRATVAYRQHGRNEVGARKRSLGHVLVRASPSGADFRESLRRSRAQARAFQDRFGSELTGARGEALAAFVALGPQSYLARRRTLLRHRLLRHGFVRNVALLLRI